MLYNSFLYKFSSWWNVKINPKGWILSLLKEKILLCVASYQYLHMVLFEMWQFMKDKQEADNNAPFFRFEKKNLPIKII